MASMHDQVLQVLVEAIPVALGQTAQLQTAQHLEIVLELEVIICMLHLAHKHHLIHPTWENLEEEVEACHHLHHQMAAVGIGIRPRSQVPHLNAKQKQSKEIDRQMEENRVHM